MTRQLWQTPKLAASIAYELNHPLSTVSLRVESALVRTPDDASVEPALEIIGPETKRMGDLVANLLQFSHREIGELQGCCYKGANLTLLATARLQHRLTAQPPHKHAPGTCPRHET
jgi:signal transduction histidine kinase